MQYLLFFQTFSKTNKGKVKKSIFATPDHVNGKIGVGTCGISGKPMTKYTHQEKWKKWLKLFILYLNDVQFVTKLTLPWDDRNIVPVSG